MQFVGAKPGKYELEVAVKTLNNNWEEPEILCSFVIERHFTKTWWFIGLIFFMIFILILFIVLGIVKLLNKRVATQLLIKELEQKALRSQMNPHFLFNTMNSIQYLITINESKLARLYISKLSMLLRRVLEHSEHNFISIEEEIKTITLYLEIEKMRYASQADIIFEVQDDLEEDLMLPPMLLQPILENALVHGLSPKEEKGVLVCKITQPKEDLLQIIITDDGIGIDHAKSKTNFLDEKKSIGLSNINQRIISLNELYPNFISFSCTHYLEDLEHPGTKVVLVFNQSKLV